MGGDGEGGGAASLGFALAIDHGMWTRAAEPGAGVARVTELARLADAAGLDSLWASEDPDGWDAFAVLGALAGVTERVRLGTGVTNPYQRPPNALAAAIATLDALSNGRAFLGLGRGQDEWHGRALGIALGKPVQVMEELVALLRAWWAPPHRASSPPGAHFRVRAWQRSVNPVQPRPPVYLAAAGPKALDLAGRIADGVLFNELSSPDYLRWAIGRVRAAAVAAGRDPAALRRFVRAGVLVTDDPVPVLERRKDTLAVIHTLPGMDRLLQTPGFDIPAIVGRVRQAMRTEEVLARGGGFPDLRAAGDFAAARAAIPLELMDRLTVVGPLPKVRARLAELAALGATDVFLAPPPPGTDAAAFREAVAALRQA